MSFTILRDDFKAIKGSIVYVFRLGAEVLYVGHSINGLRRPLDPKHTKALKSFLIADSLEIIPCPNRNEAYRLETKLIKQLSPYANDFNKELSTVIGAPISSMADNQEKFLKMIRSLAGPAKLSLLLKKMHLRDPSAIFMYIKKLRKLGYSIPDPVIDMKWSNHGRYSEAL